MNEEPRIDETDEGEVTRLSDEEVEEIVRDELQAERELLDPMNEGTGDDGAVEPESLTETDVVPGVFDFEVLPPDEDDGEEEVVGP